MAKLSANYEVVYIMDPAIGEEGIATDGEVQDLGGIPGHCDRSQ